MFLSDGLYVPTHRPLPASQLEQMRLAANRDRRTASLIAPFSATWWLLVVGALIAAAAIAAQLS
ncbi:MAG: hypothetical protein J0I79_01120 [Mesorhizobium sp.]|uniref:hypothetical protein n=1 Tax=Mesorhizobium sp. TaxID=1871066 RepID=UPI001AD10CB3|nr:hypothetical protein [Mesorhizobium sp.]MBN9216528.1 hypothetical protein [Mesorhizobium sp.]